jgi:hypothetical protein
MPQPETVSTRPGYVWITGNYKWEKGAYEWMPGHWERERAKQQYRPSRWELRGKFYIFIEGSWN